MIFLIPIFFIIMLFADMGSKYEVSRIVLFLSLIIVCVFIAHIYLLALTVKRSAQKKGLASDWTWAILTFVFGIPAAIIFAFFAGGIDDNENKKVKNNSAVLTSISFTLLAASIIGTICTGMFSEYYTSSHFPTEHPYYVTEDGQKVIYDKMGNAYTREQAETFKYYDRNGKTYVPIWHYGLFASEPDVHEYNCIEDGKVYDEFEYNLVIDSDGYFVIFPDDVLEFSMGDLYDYYDKNGNIYFYPERCNWTPDGELDFDTEAFDKMTYQDILDYEK
ncbi:MAG: hypothetical protein K2I14_07195, partial [Eubacterium sp.]|nr:hypothetical protein [Eubacterium sp.]